MESVLNENIENFEIDEYLQERYRINMKNLYEKSKGYHVHDKGQVLKQLKTELADIQGTLSVAYRSLELHKESRSQRTLSRRRYFVESLVKSESLLNELIISLDNIIRRDIESLIRKYEFKSTQEQGLESSLRPKDSETDLLVCGRHSSESDLLQTSCDAGSCGGDKEEGVDSRHQRNPSGMEEVSTNCEETGLSCTENDNDESACVNLVMSSCVGPEYSYFCGECVINTGAAVMKPEIHRPLVEHMSGPFLLGDPIQHDHGEGEVFAAVSKVDKGDIIAEAQAQQILTMGKDTTIRSEESSHYEDDNSRSVVCAFADQPCEKTAGRNLSFQSYLLPEGGNLTEAFEEESTLEELLPMNKSIELFEFCYERKEGTFGGALTGGCELESALISDDFLS